MRLVAKRMAVVAALVCAVVASAAGAQEYPNRYVTLIIPYNAGGLTDVLARIVAEDLSNRIGQRVVPDNRPGAGTAVGAGLVARAAPNGYTLLFSTMAHSLNVTMNPNLQFDSVNDFEFVGKVGQTRMIIVTNPRYVKVDDLQGLVNLMRSEPGKVSFGSAGIGTPMHLGPELLKYVSKTDAIHVPYKGENPALADLMAGQVGFMFCAIATCGPRTQDGTLKALAVTAPNRSELAPTVPTVAEAGFPGVDIGTWYFMAAPKGTPTAVVKKLNEALNEMLADEKFKKRALAMGIDLESHTSPAATKALVQSEIAKWRPIVKASGATN